MDSLRMLEFLGPMMAIYAALLALVIPFIIYVIARWRAHRDQVVDPQIGIKTALGYFAVTAFQLLLLGLAMAFYALLSNESSDTKSTIYREAFGMIVPSAIILGSHVALLGRTNQNEFPAVRRLLLGYNLLLTGTIGFIALVLAFEALFGKGSGGGMGRVAGAMVLVYGSAWAAVGVHFGRTVLGFQPPSEPPAQAPPSRTPAPAAGPSLPPLGGGAYPPISEK